jgi:hypothetical protein
VNPGCLAGNGNINSVVYQDPCTRTNFPDQTAQIPSGQVAFPNLHEVCFPVDRRQPAVFIDMSRAIGNLISDQTGFSALARFSF